MPPFPSNIHIETSSRCNLKCCQCVRTHLNYESKNKDLSFELFKKVIDDLCTIDSEKFSILRLQGIGEPTLNHDLISMIHYANEKDIFENISFISNGCTVYSYYYKECFASGLDTLIVSIDSFNPKVLDAIRWGTDSDVLLRNISELTEDFADKISIATSVNKLNVGELGKLGEFFVSIGINSWHLQPMIDWNFEIQGKGGKLSKKDFYLNSDELYLANAVLKKFGDTIELRPLIISSERCNLPFSWFNVNSMGYVMPCFCNSDHDLIHFGNIKDTHIFESWASKEFEKFRDDFDARQIDMCSQCPIDK